MFQPQPPGSRLEALLGVLSLQTRAILCLGLSNVNDLVTRRTFLERSGRKTAVLLPIHVSRGGKGNGPGQFQQFASM